MHSDICFRFAMNHHSKSILSEEVWQRRRRRRFRRQVHDQHETTYG